MVSYCIIFHLKVQDVHGQAICMCLTCFKKTRDCAPSIRRLLFSFLLRPTTPAMIKFLFY